MSHYVAAILRNVADLIETNTPAHHVAVNIPDPAPVNPDHDSLLSMNIVSIDSSMLNPRKKPVEAIPRESNIPSHPVDVSIPDPVPLNPDHDSLLLFDLVSIDSSILNPRKRPAEDIPRELNLSSRLRSSSRQKKVSQMVSEDGESISTRSKERHATTAARSEILRTCPFIFEEPKDSWRDLSKRHNGSP
jgi:hypothetical protein